MDGLPACHEFVQNLSKNIKKYNFIVEPSAAYPPLVYGKRFTSKYLYIFSKVHHRIFQLPNKKL